MKIRVIKFSTALLGGALLFLIQVVASTFYEPRSPFANFFLEGGLILSVLWLLALFAFVTGCSRLSKGESRVAIGQLLGAGFCLIIFGFSLFWEVISPPPQLKEDRIVYASRNSSHEKLILQHYETGVTGNPNWRAILVKDESLHFRRFRTVDLNLFGRDALFQFSLMEGINYSRIPKTVKIEGKEYFLENSLSPMPQTDF
ncbi:hypothetical protein [Nibribacter koreensis]|uniref:Uncharacterized protein n=1 Tax=Nibribacter koreensis TaxID=1084519 RepID=A0ABP8FF65_9BACT